MFICLLPTSNIPYCIICHAMAFALRNIFLFFRSWHGANEWTVVLPND